MSRNKLLLGAHVVIFSRKPDADRRFLRDVFGLSNVDAGEGWLIFALPSAELAVHPSPRNNLHELYFLCRDIDVFVASMKTRGIRCSPIQTLSWGKLAQIRLPGGGRLGVYQSLHPHPEHSLGPQKGIARRIASRKHQ